jgi:MOSC domain-containing protein YiiM
MSELSSLLSQRRAPGKVIWIGVRDARGATMRALEHASLLDSHGVEGDYASRGRGGGKRQVTIMQAEHLEVIAKLVGRAQVSPEEMRRNLVVERINLHALRMRTFRIGQAVLEGTGYCEPCSKMERAFGVGGYNAVRGHGGILARVLRGAIVRVGDEVDFAEL